MLGELVSFVVSFLFEYRFMHAAKNKEASDDRDYAIPTPHLALQFLAWKSSVIARFCYSRCHDVLEICLSLVL
jgi:hypothetical protein